MARCERGRSIPNASGSASQTWQNCRAGSRRPTRSGWSAFWETDPPTHRGWRLSYSTRVRRSTWRELPARSPKASAGRGKSSRRARRGPRSIVAEKCIAETDVVAAGPARVAREHTHVGDEQIEQAVTIVVEKDGAGRMADVAHTGRGGDVAEHPVA